MNSRGGHRNRIENCVVRDNGSNKPGVGIEIRGKTRDIVIHGTTLGNTPGGNQKTGICIGAEARQITVQGNTFSECPVQIEDLRPTGSE